jgi:hypothetical protein
MSISCTIYGISSKILMTEVLLLKNTKPKFEVGSSAIPTSFKTLILFAAPCSKPPLTDSENRRNDSRHDMTTICDVEILRV